MFFRSQHVRRDHRSEPELAVDQSGHPEGAERRNGLPVPGGRLLGSAVRRHRARDRPARHVDVRRGRVHLRRSHHDGVPVARVQPVRGTGAPGIRLRLAGRGLAQLHGGRRQRAVPKRVHFTIYYSFPRFDSGEIPARDDRVSHRCREC